MYELRPDKSVGNGPVRAVKSVRCEYVSSAELSSLFKEFQLMCNDAIRIALQETPKSKFELIEMSYSRLKEYNLHTHYILSACEVAYSAYKNKNRKTNPYVRRCFLKIDNQSYQLSHLILRVPTKPRHFAYLALRASDYHLAFIDDPSLKKGEIIITERAVSIPFTKKVMAVQSRGRMGIDINEENVTWSDTNGKTEQEDISKVAEINRRYREIRAKIGRVARQDNRISGRLYEKYGKRESNRKIRLLHRISKKVVQHAKENRLCIAVENLKGIRKLYRTGNGQGLLFRGRMNSWPFHEIQRQIKYKAAWLGVPVYHVNPRGTSRNCPDCGSRVVPLPKRQLYCVKCDRTWDRDVLASKNIMACVVPQARPPK